MHSRQVATAAVTHSCHARPLGGDAVVLLEKKRHVKGTGLRLNVSNCIPEGSRGLSWSCSGLRYCERGVVATASVSASDILLQKAPQGKSGCSKVPKD
jgi:hypothetical protein